jgi:hypothetical protein
MAFTDLALILVFEFRLCNFLPSFAQAFRGQYNIRLISDITRAFFLKNGMAKESGSYDELILRLENTNDVSFDIK